MAKSDFHQLDLLGDELRADLAQRLQAAQKELAGSVPMGQRRLSPVEKFKRYMALSSQERDFFRQSLGDRWGQYEEDQMRFAVSILGGAAANLLPYIAPTMAAAMEVDSNEQE